MTIYDRANAAHARALVLGPVNEQIAAARVQLSVLRVRRDQAIAAAEEQAVRSIATIGLYATLPGARRTVTVDVRRGWAALSAPARNLHVVAPAQVDAHGLTGLAADRHASHLRWVSSGGLAVRADRHDVAVKVLANALAAVQRAHDGFLVDSAPVKASIARLEAECDRLAEQLPSMAGVA
jgi:hypothetical protein